MMPLFERFDNRRTRTKRVIVDGGGGGEGIIVTGQYYGDEHDVDARAATKTPPNNIQGIQHQHPLQQRRSSTSIMNTNNNFQAASTLRESFQRRLSNISSSAAGMPPPPINTRGAKNGKQSSTASSSSGGGDLLMGGKNPGQQRDDIHYHSTSTTTDTRKLARDGMGEESPILPVDSTSPSPFNSSNRSRKQKQQQNSIEVFQAKLATSKKEGTGGLLSSEHRGSRSSTDQQSCNSSVGSDDDDVEDNDDDGDVRSTVSSLDSLASPVSIELKKSLRKIHPSPTKPSSSSKSTPSTSSTSLDDANNTASVVETNPSNIVVEDPHSNNVGCSSSSHRRHRMSSFNHKRQSSSDKSHDDNASLGIDDLCASTNNNNNNNRDSFLRTSGLGNDIALHLEYSTTSMNTYYSSDGIDQLHPANDTDKGRDDFEFAWNAYSEAILFGHFDFKGGRGGGGNREALSMAGEKEVEEDDQVLAAKAYMGLGFVRQCKGELGSCLDAYRTSLALWKDAMIGEDTSTHASASSVVPSLLYTIGTVLVEMQQLLEASDYFTKALHRFKNRIANNTNPASVDGGGDRVDVLTTEGMLFNLFGDADRAIICLNKAMLGVQSASSKQPMSLKLAAVMFEMGSLHIVLEMYEKSANFFHLALGIRKALLGDSFLVARTHYSLGVTLASQELKTNNINSSSSSSEYHLKEALRICQKEFESEHIQSAIIVRALGVLTESKGDSLSASVWFAKELTLRKLLLGEGTIIFQ
jgi:tetratricopeptide (TPR) repeat protein